MSDAILIRRGNVGWKRIAVVGLVGVFLVGLFYVVYIVRVKKDMSDFGVCYRAGQRVLGQETLYRTVDGHLQYKYAPVSALFFSAFALLPFEAAKLVWYCLQLICLFAAFWISYRCLPSARRGKGFVIGLGLLILLKFTGREIELGQVNSLIIFILVLMLSVLIRRREFAAGILWGISIFFKPYALVFLPYFVLKWRPKLLVSGIAVLAAGLFAPVFIFGWQGNLIVLGEWTDTLSQSTPVLMAVSDNASLYAFLWKLLGEQNTVWVKIVFGAVFSGLAVTFLWMMRRGRKSSLRQPETLEVAFLFTLIPLFSPLGWYYNYLYALLAVVLLLNEMGRFPAAIRYISAANFVIVGASLREILGKTIFRFYSRNSLIVLNAMIILGCLAYARWRKQS